MNTWIRWVAAGGALLAGGAQALQVSSFSPQGEVAQVRQVVARFDAAAVRFGDPQAPAPFTVQCSDADAAKGTGRWTGEREWVFDFARDLPPGVRCTATARSGFKSASGAELSGAKSYQFNSGGPFVRRILPGTYQSIDEEQVFVLQLNGAATQDSLRSHAWCALDGVGERVPVRLVEGAQRGDILKALGLDKRAAQAPLQYATLACNRRLTSGTRMQLVFGKGVATPSGVANTVEKRFAFQVREPFAVEFQCERENAQAACLPIRPMVLSFNAPVSRKVAAGIRLKSSYETLLPRFEGEGEGTAAQPGDTLVNAVRFGVPLAESTSFTVELPADFRDAAGRAPRNAASFPLKVATGGMPPLAKFAAAPFGIVERFAEGPAEDHPPALLPVTLRKVEPALRVQGLQPASTPEAPAGRVRTLQPGGDAEIIAWMRKVRRYHGALVERGQARRDGVSTLPQPLQGQENKEYVQTRMLSLLAGQSGAKALELPRAAAADPRPFEVVGIPLAPGFHVVEVASQALGGALLDERHGAGRTMYVRTAALVTNLG
ncbi:Ig-like domain-containing protein, partial [Diaphorobacter nitroreducens]|uniref:Ig-like domain-containing protein n=2 Tax=Diaphorobacter TaxID=238749 RepID=UPI0035E41A34